jgi:hypothetical protein
MASPVSGLREPPKSSRSVSESMSFRPPVWVQPYLPHSWQEAFYGGMVDPKSDPGNPKPLVKPVSEYPVFGSDPVVREWRQRASRMYESPVMQNALGKSVSPGDYVQGLAREAGLGEGESDLMREYVRMHLTRESTPPASANVYARRLLDDLKKQGPGGKDAQFAGWTRQQRDDAKTSGFQETRYMMSPGLRKNLEADRARSVLSALQEDPQLRPDWSTAGSSMLSVPAAGFAGASEILRRLLTDAQVGDDSPHTTSNWAPGALHLAYLRNMHSVGNPAEARIGEAVYWDRLAEERNRENQYRSALFGGYGPGESWMTTKGMAQQGDQDMGNPLTYAEKVKTLGFSGVPVLQGEHAEAIRDVLGDLQRPAPLIPEGATPEEAKAMADKVNQYISGEESQYVAEYPLYQRTWNQGVDAIGSLAPSLADNLRVQQYSLPSPVNNNVAMSGKYWLDVPTLAMLGLTLPKAIAQGGVRGALGGLLGDFVTDQATVEQPFGTALYASNPPYNTQPGKLLESMDHQGMGVVPVFPARFTESGQRVMADPNASDYPEHYARWRESQQKLLEDILEYHKKYYEPRVALPTSMETSLMAKEL